jgi:hypothetical protein
LIYQTRDHEDFDIRLASQTNISIHASHVTEGLWAVKTNFMAVTWDILNINVQVRFEQWTAASDALE